MWLIQSSFSALSSQFLRPRLSRSSNGWHRLPANVWTKCKTNLEIALNILAEASATELSKQRDPKGFNAQTQVAKDGGSVAKAARNQLESKLGRSIISSAKASDYLLPNDSEEKENN